MRDPAAVGREVTVDGEPVAVDADSGASEAWRQCADVLYGSRPRPAEAAHAWSGELLRRYPGCLLAAASRTGGGCTLAVRDARPPFIELPCTGRMLEGEEATTLLSLWYALLVDSPRGISGGRPVRADAGGPEADRRRRH